MLSYCWWLANWGLSQKGTKTWVVWVHILFIIIIIILRLWSRRLQDFSMHFDLWQAWLSDLLVYCLLHTPKTVECRLSKMCVGILVSSCHEVGCRVHIYWQALLLGDGGCAQETSTGNFENGQEARCWSWNISCTRNMIFSFYINLSIIPVAGSRKGIDFTFHVMRYHPRFTAIEEDGHAGDVE